MTVTTDTTSLAALLSAKRTEVEQPPAEMVEPTPEVEVMPAIHASAEVPAATEHGEIVPVAAPMAEYEPHYPDIPPKVVGGLPYVRDYMKLARTIHSTEMVPVAFKGRPDAILATFLRGYELGFGPMQALDSFNVIQGKVGLTAESMRALTLDNGHDIILEDVLVDGALVGIKADCHRKNWPTARWASYVYTTDDARRANLLNKTSWKENLRAMLDARATSGACRRYFADVLAGMSYTPEEIRDFTDDDGGASSQPTQQQTPPPPPPVTEPGGGTEAKEPPDAPAPTAEPEPSVTPESASPEATAPNTDGTPISPEPGSSPPPDPAPAPNARKKAADRTPEEQAAKEQDSAARLELRKGLTAVINSLDAPNQPLCRAYLAQNGYSEVRRLSAAKLQEAINIAAGWPESVRTPDDGIENAEIVEDTDPALFDA